MTNSLTFTLVHTKGVRFLSDLDKLNSTPELRDTLRGILDKKFNSEYIRCQPHIYYLVSTIIGMIFLTIAILLIKFTGNIGFYFLPVGILGIISPCFFTCWSDKKSSSLFYNVMTKIDSETFGIHKMTGTFHVTKYINTFTLSTNVERLKRIKGNQAEPKPKPQPKPPQPQPPKKLTPAKLKPQQNKIILHDNPNPVNPPPNDKPYNPLQPQPVDNRLTIDSGQGFNPNRFSQGGPIPHGPQPFYGPYQNNPGQPPMGGFSPFPQYTPFGPMPNPNGPPLPGQNVNMNQPFPNDDLMIHEVNVGGKGNNMNYGPDLYTVPSHAVDDHSEKKK
jgi:hypothetical protein